ncbi:MAG TPA: hypothetical protein VK436_12980 [Methanocella sp.]|nr:hypothetical protein [Methanocella sp.]
MKLFMNCKALLRSIPMILRRRSNSEEYTDMGVMNEAIGCLKSTVEKNFGDHLHDTVSRMLS